MTCLCSVLINDNPIYTVNVLLQCRLVHLCVKTENLYYSVFSNILVVSNLAMYNSHNYAMQHIRLRPNIHGYMTYVHTALIVRDS